MKDVVKLMIDLFQTHLLATAAPELSVGETGAVRPVLDTQVVEVAAVDVEEESHLAVFAGRGSKDSGEEPSAVAGGVGAYEQEVTGKRAQRVVHLWQGRDVLVVGWPHKHSK
jgi:hypothetical protein